MSFNYEPLSATEQDVVQRMLEQEDLYVEVVGWGYHPKPQITAGDKRIQIRFPMIFTRPVGVTVPVNYFRLRLKNRAGDTLVETVESTVINNRSLPVTAGIQIDLIWDLALDSISEEVQKQVLPGIRGKRVGSIIQGNYQKDEDQ